MFGISFHGTYDNGGYCSRETSEGGTEGKSFGDTNTTCGQDSLEVSLPWDPSKHKHDSVVDLGLINVSQLSK